MLSTSYGRVVPYNGIEQGIYTKGSHLNECVDEEQPLLEESELAALTGDGIEAHSTLVILHAYINAIM